MLKRILKYAMWAFLILIGFLILLTVIVYLPPVQNFAVRKASAYVEENLGMHLDIEKFRIRFPLTLSVDNAVVVDQRGDTILRSGEIRARIALFPLMGGNVKIGSFGLRETAVNYSDTSSDMSLKADIGSLDLGRASLNLKQNEIDISKISLSDGTVDFRLGRPVADTASMSAWDVGLGRLDLDRIAFTMRSTAGAVQLTADLGSGRLDNCMVNTGSQLVSVDLVRLEKGNYHYSPSDDNLYAVGVPDPDMGARSAGSVSQQTGLGEANSAAPGEGQDYAHSGAMAMVTTSTALTYDTLPVAASEPWTVSVRRIELVDNGGLYNASGGMPAAGPDMEHLAVSGLNFTADSVFNRGTDISAAIRQLSFAERSGFEVSSGEGRFRMDSSGLKLAGFRLRTPSSSVDIDAEAGAGILLMSGDAPVKLTVGASVGIPDLITLFPGERNMLQNFKGQTVTVSGDVAGRLGDLDIHAFDITLPGHMKLDVEGRLLSIVDPAAAEGSIHFNGTFRNMGFARRFLPGATMRNRISIPAFMAITGNIGFAGGEFKPALTVVADSGRLSLNGRFAPTTEAYDIRLTSRNFPLGGFLPTDSLGLLSMDLSANGRGFDPTNGRMSADVNLSVERVNYKRYEYRDIMLDGSFADNRFTGSLSSQSDALQVSLDLDGSITGKEYFAHIAGRVPTLDMQAMNLSPEPLSASLVLDVSATVSTASPQILYDIDAEVGSMRLTHDEHTDYVDKFTLTAKADDDDTNVRLRTGDLSLDFDVQLPLSQLLASLTGAMDAAQQQVAAQSLDIAELERELPPFDLSLQAGSNNIVHSFAQQQGFGFDKVSLTALHRGDSTPFRIGGIVNGLKTGSLTLDTLNIGARRDGEQLRYHMRLANRPGHIDQLALIYVYGAMAGDSAVVNVYQRNSNGENGFRFGLDAHLGDSAVRVSMMPGQPVLAYDKWTVNDDNYIVYSFDKQIYADLRLERATGHIKLQSADHPGAPDGSVRVDISGLNIGKMLDLLPTPPAVGGLLKSDIVFGMAEGMISANGSAGVKDLSYDRKVIGDISTIIKTNNDASGRWNIDASLRVDSLDAFRAAGTYDTRDGAMNIRLDLNKLPLALANPFLPENAAILSGTLGGYAILGGTALKPDVRGRLGFGNGRLAIPITGTSFGISGDSIRITEESIRFRDFGLTDPDKKRLTVNGIVDIRDLSEMTAALVVEASNFDVVSSSRNLGSQVYGTASIDVDVNIRGALDNLDVRGDVKLLRGTDVVYIMQDAPLKIEDQKQDIVTFVSFADSTVLVVADSAAAMQVWGMNMRINVDIEDDVEATVNLSDNGENRVELIGGGNLTYTMNNQGDSRFTGRYTLSGGTVVYSPPIISQKNFAIDDGSYVEWTGDIANPAFNITAVETLRTTVTMEDGTDSNVDFDLSIILGNTLDNMTTTFDLAAPNDITIQNQLSSLTAEQRSEQAMSLLIYNTYTGPGTTASVDKNSPLNTFFEKELNQWARNNLRNVDVSFGIQDYDDMSADGKHTDYSYKVSKDLFGDRVKMTVGGSINSDASAQDNLAQNFVEDVSLEYKLTKRDNMFLKLYRYNTQESILEGEVIETGAGFLLRKRMEKLSELFKLNRNPQKKEDRNKSMYLRRQWRNEERQAERSSMPRRRHRSDSLPADSLTASPVMPETQTGNHNERP